MNEESHFVHVCLETDYEEEEEYITESEEEDEDEEYTMESEEEDITESEDEEGEGEGIIEAEEEEYITESEEEDEEEEYTMESDEEEEEDITESEEEEEAGEREYILDAEGEGITEAEEEEGEGIIETEEEEGEGTIEAGEGEEGDGIMEAEQEEEGEGIMEAEEEGEGEGEDIMESEEEDEEEEAEQLEEMKPPVVTSWMGPDGITIHGIICIDDGIIRLKNRCLLDDCAICYKPSSTHGKHQLCCLPCGHMYGFSCIKKWLLQSSSSGKCPQCKTLCSFQDVLLLYPPRLCLTDHQKASSAAFFPFTEHGASEFKKYESSRVLDAQLLRAADITHMNILVTKHNNLANRVKELTRRCYNLLTRAGKLEERGESLGQADALRRRASPLEPRVEALRRRTNALEQLVKALRRRMDALEQRSDASESRMRFYRQMYKEHHNREEEIAKEKQRLKRKRKRTEAAAKGEKEAEKAAGKKQACGTVEVEEETLYVQ